MSLTARMESFLQEHLWGPMQQPHFVAHRLQFANQCVQQWFLLSWKSTSQFVEDVRRDPPIYRNPKNANEILVRLPPWFLVKDPVTLDVVCFATSAIAFRIYLFWRGWATQRRRRRRTLDDDDDDDDYNGGIGSGAIYDNRRRRMRPSPPVVKATKVVGFEDASLRQTMKECQHVKQKLRKVQDPEQKRRERQKQFKYNNNKQGSSGGFLGMSQDTLQRARNDLKQVTGSSNYNNNYYYSQANRWPLSTKENNRM